MDYINYVKQSPMMGRIGLGGGAASLGRYQSAGGGSGGGSGGVTGFYGRTGNVSVIRSDLQNTDINLKNLVIC